MADEVKRARPLLEAQLGAAAGREVTLRLLLPQTQLRVESVSAGLSALGAIFVDGECKKPFDGAGRKRTVRCIGLTGHPALVAADLLTRRTTVKGALQQNARRSS